MVFATLATGPTPPRPEEYAPFIDRLVRAGDYRGALGAWRLIARAGVAEAAGLRDGDFAGVADQTAFTWRDAQGVGADSSAGPAPGGAPGRALRVDYDGFSAPTLPAQLLVLAPGRYRLTWRQALQPSATSALSWRVRCADSGQTLGDSAAHGADPAAPLAWRAMAMSFTTPASGCAGQWLELTAAPGDRREPVTAWYAGFRLEPEP
jgi:hypothetical protein